jgi:hypothetical protein
MHPFGQTTGQGLGSQHALKAIDSRPETSRRAGRVATAVVCLALAVTITACQSLTVKPGALTPSVHLKSASLLAASGTVHLPAQPSGTVVAQRRPARFTGIATYVDPRGLYTFRYPSDWTQIANTDGDGVAFVPNEDDPRTVITSYASQISWAVGSRDLALLGRQVDGEIGRLPDAVIRERNDEAIGEVLRLDRVVSFRDGDQSWKRSSPGV